MAKTKQEQAPQERQPAKNRPERKIGPFAGGVGVAIWINTIDTANGPRDIRSISIAPRRYRDRDSGEWRDAPSYRPMDLPALIVALERALHYCLETPLPGQDQNGDAGGDDNIPF